MKEETGALCPENLQDCQPEELVVLSRDQVISDAGALLRQFAEDYRRLAL